MRRRVRSRSGRSSVEIVQGQGIARPYRRSRRRSLTAGLLVIRKGPRPRLPSASGARADPHPARHRPAERRRPGAPRLLPDAASSTGSATRRRSSQARSARARARWNGSPRSSGSSRSICRRCSARSRRHTTSPPRASCVRLIRELKPDVLHTHTAKAGAVGRLAARLAGPARPRAVVHTFHGHVLRGYFSPAKTAAFRRLERSLARSSDALIAVSPGGRDDLVALGVAPRGEDRRDPARARSRAAARRSRPARRRRCAPSSAFRRSGSSSPGSAA